MPVEAGGQSDYFLVAARTVDGLIQLLVPRATPGVTVIPAESLDLTRRFAEVRFDNAAVPQSAVVGNPADTSSEIERQLQVANVIQLAEMVGAMNRAFDITIDWAFNRYSFGRPLASYQELKHRFADMKAWLEAGHAIADAAARHAQDESDAAAEYTSAGKAYMGIYGVELVQDCVQMHGGIGVTFDHDMHLYLRRVVIDSITYGTVADHRQRVTSILEKRGQA
jgi:alkylation response protein AidB-like acyl-CoA dehydrogenase